jgi:hypothetical protein
MASTYSDLKIELIGTGEQTGTWGSTTNTNLGTALEEAITGSADVSFSSSDVTLTLTNTNGTQTARNLRLVCTGTSGGARNLILGSGCQIEKLYLIQNDLADTVTVKNTTGTGVAVLAGAKVFVFNDGTNVVTATNLGVVSLANGGTGAALTDPNADRILFWDDSAGSTAFLTVGTGLSISGTTLSATSGGTVTSVALTAPTGFSVSGSPVTSSGTLALSFAAGYSLPTTASQANWDTAFTDRLKWDGGSSGLTASTGRTSLGLGSLATLSAVGTSQITDANVTAAKLSGAQSGSAPIFGCRAFVTFDGEGTVSTNQSILRSGNVTSVYKNGEGDYTITMTTALPSTAYTVNVNAGNDGVGSWAANSSYQQSPTTTVFRIATTNLAGSPLDASRISVVVFG